MPGKTVEDLIERLKGDEAFRDEVMEEPDPAVRLRLIQAAGYACSQADLASLGARLEEAALADVVGGVLDPAGCVQPWNGLANF